MIQKRPAGERGKTQFDWLDGRHSFSFGDYEDPAHQNFRSLRVINEDVIAPGGGFGTHPHRNAEIFTYVIEGAIRHQDSMGNESVIQAGNLQYMSAGSGVRHSEFNASNEKRAHLLQIWLLPNTSGGEPLYGEKQMDHDAQKNALTPLFGGKDFPIRQDAEIAFGRLDAGKSVTLPDSRPFHWIQMIQGEVQVLGETLKNGDGLAISDEKEITLRADTFSDFLVFHLS